MKHKQAKKQDSDGTGTTLPTAAGRRRSSGINVAVYIVGLLIVVVLVNLLARKINFTADLTRGGRYTLSPRTKTIIHELQQPLELALVLEPGSLTSIELDDLDSLLKAYQRAGDGEITITRINAGSPGDVAAFDALVHRLRSLYADSADRMQKLLDDALRVSKTQAQVLNSAKSGVQAALAEVTRESEASKAVAQYLGLLSNHSRAMSEAVQQATRMLDTQSSGTPIPDYDSARAILAAAMDQPTRLTGIYADYFDILSKDNGVTATGRSKFAALSRIFRNGSNELAKSREALLRPEPLELSEIVRGMQSTSYLLVLGSERAASIPLSSLFPADNRTGIRRFAGEEAISVVIASLTTTETPLVYFLHAEKQSLFGPNSGLITIAQRLSGQRIHLAEWSVATSADPPQIPFPDAPRVYIVIPPGDRNTDSLERRSRLATVVADLINQGECVLYHLAPSSLAAAGQNDVLLEPLKPLGISARTDLQIISSASSPAGPVISDSLEVDHYHEGHIVSDACRNLPSRFYDLVPLIADKHPENVSITPLIEVGSSSNDNIWAESDWLGGQWQKATPDGNRDISHGPFTIAYACERVIPDSQKTQRVIIIGCSPSWMGDNVAGQNEGGVLTNPGNAELLDACVYYLAHLDKLVMPGTASVQVPRVAGDAPVRAAAWITIVVMPALVLILGFIVMILRKRNIAD
ncbi:MAG TPA: hypothetical protein ENJ06_06355 [Phycisphaeraceae bacterium]|nr:hypothetical protein [Phycisphaeraceae bacterium]